MKKIINGLVTVLMLGLTLIMLLPFAYMIIVSLQETYSPYLISFDFTTYTLGNYSKVFQVSGFSRWLLNSVFVSVSGVILTLCVCNLAAFAFAKKRFPGNDTLFFVLFLTMCIPFPATVVPLWLITGWAGLIDTFWPLILPIPSMLGVVLIRQAILAVPKEMFECARLDGCNDLRIFTKIVTPIIRPILITVGILYFSRSWNSLLWPLIVTNTDMTKTLPVGLAALQGTTDVNYGITMAGAMMNFLPSFLVYVFMHKYFLAGIAGSGLKN